MTSKALAFLLATCLVSPAFAAQLEKIDHPPALHSLPLFTPSRVLISPPGGPGLHDYASQWPGTYFEAAFKGTQVFFETATEHEILHLVIDDQKPLILTDPLAGFYRISGLSNSTHSVALFIATENQGPASHFRGFAISSAETPLAPPKRSRQIEFIGDSHTVGFGNLSPKPECSNDEVFSSTDNTQAFGPLTAAYFHADYQVNAISGRGIVRNYNGATVDTIPAAYPYLLFHQSRPYRDPAWSPQVIVIALGTNDFSTPLKHKEKWKTRDQLHADFEATYVRFLETLRARNPAAYIILWASDLLYGEVASEEQRVVDRMKAHGEARIAFLRIDHLSCTGCFYHPSAADDQAIKDQLAQFIAAQPNIWQGKAP